MNNIPHKRNHKQLYETIATLPCFNEGTSKLESANDVHCVTNKPIEIKRIEAGQSSLCFDITYQNKKYFAKYDENIPFFENELKASKAASIINLSPQVIYADQHWLVNEFIEGKTLDKASISIKDKINIALSLMSRCHTLKVSIPLLQVTDIVTQIISNHCFSNRQKQYIDKLLKQLPSIPECDQVMCHGDINFSNIITRYESSWLIDFECCCLAEKEFELAMFSAINRLSVDEQKYVVQGYQDINVRRKINLKKFAKYLLYSYLINGLWYIEKVKNSTSSKNHPFYQLALEQFNLFDSMYLNDSPLSLIMR